MERKDRRLKVYSKFQKRSGYNLSVPEIRLCGKWLREAGLEINSSIVLKISKGKIVIKVLR